MDVSLVMPAFWLLGGFAAFTWFGELLVCYV